MTKSPRGNIDALRSYRREQSEQKQGDVLRAIQSLKDEGKDLTVAGVSRRASVSREFIHKHAHLHSAVTKAASQAKEVLDLPSQSSSTDLARGLRADRTTLLGRIEKQRTQIADQKGRIQQFERDRQRWLGAQLERADTVDPEIHAELRIENERLSAENMRIAQQVSDLRRVLAILEGDLAASRQAHAEEVAGRLAVVRPLPRR